MWTIRAAASLLALAMLGARAEPRIPGMDAALEERLARGDYVFVWDLDMETIGRGDPYRTASTYYDGLMYAVTEARRLIEPGTPARLQLHPAAHVRGWDEAYVGTLASRQTYLDGKPIVLHAEVYRRDCDSHRAQVFFAVSLKAPAGPAWDAMRQARDRLSCDPAKN
ncbi:MAG TPA: hypothetical protein VH040_18595 [Usitatibacter sp.]|jgi:hypothetical protein|nr:hypothetical protein [Usitatibacter sp.]